MALGRLLECAEQQAKLAGPADERRFTATRQGGFGRLTDQAPDLERLGLALELHERQGGELEGFGRQPARAGADIDLPRLGGLLESGGNVHRVAGHGVLVLLRAGSGTTHHFACVDADPDLQVVARLGHRGTDGESGMERACGVIIVGLGCTVDGHHGIPDVLLDGATVTLDLCGHGAEVGALDLADLLGIGLFGPGREADEVDEQHGDEAAFFGDGHGRIVPHGFRC